MKYILLSFLLFLTISTQAVEMKKVCHDTVIKGKTVQDCKVIKVHKKLEGTNVPEKKKNG